MFPPLLYPLFFLRDFSLFSWLSSYCFLIYYTLLFNYVCICFSSILSLSFYTISSLISSTSSLLLFLLPPTSRFPPYFSRPTVLVFLVYYLSYFSFLSNPSSSKGPGTLLYLQFLFFPSLPSFSLQLLWYYFF
jgi:hypothetical protein